MTYFKLNGFWCYSRSLIFSEVHTQSCMQQHLFKPEANQMRTAPWPESVRTKF